MFVRQTTPSRDASATTHTGPHRCRRETSGLLDRLVLVSQERHLVGGHGHQYVWSQPALAVSSSLLTLLGTSAQWSSGRVSFVCILTYRQLYLTRSLACSRQLCRVHIRAAHLGHAARRFVCLDRVRRGLALLFDTMADAICRAVLASFFLNERLGRIGVAGCSLCLVGTVIIILHAPEDKEVNTIDEMLDYALRPGAQSQCLMMCRRC